MFQSCLLILSALFHCQKMMHLGIDNVPEENEQKRRSPHDAFPLQNQKPKMFPWKKYRKKQRRDKSMNRQLKTFSQDAYQHQSHHIVAKLGRTTYGSVRRHLYQVLHFVQFITKKHGSLRHGRVENPVPAWLRTDFLRTAHTRIKRGSKLEWYSRRTMWEFAEKLGKDCVEDLNDVEFIDGLHSVHTHFRKHPASRVSWNLQRHMGPQTLDDKNDEDKLNYVGSPLVHKFYDRGIFIEELRGLDNTLFPETASERQFEEALRRTYFIIMSAWSTRAITSEYQGPQQYAHRFCIQRINFSLDETFIHRQGIDDKNYVTWLKCDSCEKWRRVDMQTLHTYSNDTFHGGARKRRCSDLQAKVPSFIPFLSMFLRQRKLQDPFFILTEFILTHALANASTLLQSLLHEDSKRAVFELS